MHMHTYSYLALVTIKTFPLKVLHSADIVQISEVRVTYIELRMDHS